MIQEMLTQLLPELEVDPRTVSALLCASAAAVAALNWMQRRRIQEKMEEARRMRDLGLQRMEKAVQRFKQQVTFPHRERDCRYLETCVEMAAFTGRGCRNGAVSCVGPSCRWPPGL